MQCTDLKKSLGTVWSFAPNFKLYAFKLRNKWKIFAIQEVFQNVSIRNRPHSNQFRGLVWPELRQKKGLKVNEAFSFSLLLSPSCSGFLFSCCLFVCLFVLPLACLLFLCFRCWELCWCWAWPGCCTPPGKASRSLWSRDGEASWKAGRWGWSRILQCSLRSPACLPQPSATCPCHHGPTGEAWQKVCGPLFFFHRFAQQCSPLKPDCVFTLLFPEKTVWHLGCRGRSLKLSAWPPGVWACTGEERTLPWWLNLSIIRSWSSTGEQFWPLSENTMNNDYIFGQHLYLFIWCSSVETSYR